MTATQLCHPSTNAKHGFVAIGQSLITSLAPLGCAIDQAEIPNIIDTTNTNVLPRSSSRPHNPEKTRLSPRATISSRTP